jgi:sulfopyruvate decarboxylase subunit alpha
MFWPEEFRRADHPVCGVSVAAHLFIDAAATPPFQGGECDSFTPSDTPGFKKPRRATAQRRQNYTSVLQSAAVPVSLANSKIVYDGLRRSGVKIVSALPETWLVHLINMAEADPDMTLVRLTREEEAIGISAGAHLAGVRSALLMQNHGFLAAINPIISLAFLYKIPLLMLISYRGHMGERDPWQTQGGRFTEPVLKALDIPYDHLTDSNDVERQISEAQTLAESSLTPVALLLSRQLMWEA